MWAGVFKGSEVKNNLDPGQATMVVFPDTMYTYRDTQGAGGGGGKNC